MIFCEKYFLFNFFADSDVGPFWVARQTTMLGFLSVYVARRRSRPRLLAAASPSQVSRPGFPSCFHSYPWFVSCVMCRICGFPVVLFDADGSFCDCFAANLLCILGCALMGVFLRLLLNYGELGTVVWLWASCIWSVLRDDYNGGLLNK